MYKKLILAAAGAMVLALASFDAQAMPLSTLSDTAPGVTLVAGGCGPGFHRGPRGACIRNGGPVIAPRRVLPRAVVVPPRRVVAPRVCPRGFHLNPRRGVCVRNF